jgi:hypothetical protein
MSHYLTAEIYGGQGNQMFQIAMAHILAKKIDCIPVFNKKDTATVGKVRNVNWTTLFQKCNEPPKEVSTTKPWLRILDSHLDEFMEKATPQNTEQCNIHMEGYFQVAKYLIPHRDFLKDFFFSCFENEDTKAILDKYNPQTKIAIHIRNFELTANAGEKCVQFYDTAPWAYYKSVLHNYPELKYKEVLLFLDDVCEPEEVKKYFKNGTIVEESEDVSLYIMSKCQYLIRSNSTYSWWASFLSDSIQKVYVPDPEWTIHPGTFNTTCKLDNFYFHPI